MPDSFIINDKLQNEIDLVLARLDNQDSKDEFNEFKEKCTSLDELETLMVRYRQLLPDLYDPFTWGSLIYEPIRRPITIAYLLNEDKIFYSELDFVICNYLRNEGALVVTFKIEDFCYKASTTGIDIFIKNQKHKFDGFLTYGYRKKSSMDVYFLIARIMEDSGAVCLHDHNIDAIVNNKLLQSIKFATAGVPIPETYEVFNTKSALTLIEKIDKNIIPCVLKPLDDYGGEGLLKYEDSHSVIDKLNKTYWKGRNLLLQKLIPDSIGRSIRVLCFDGKAFALAEYEDQSGGFTSNFCFGEKFRLISLMDHPKRDEFSKIAENAIKSVGDVLIGGVDLLDSEKNGVVVLEINGWPDVFDIWFQTNKCGFKQLAVSFMNKIKNSIQASTPATV